MKSAPISKQERIAPIDIIRGFALFGIFLVNMPAFHSPAFMIPYPEYTGSDKWLDLFLQMFVQNKFYTIFSFLFGLGFFIFMSRAEQKGLRINRLFSRRLLALLLFGLAHFIFLWFGDILHTYALAGFFLLLFYKRKTKTLLIWAFSLLLVFHALISLQFFAPESIIKEFQMIDTEKEQKITEYVDVYEHANYNDWVSFRLKTELIPIMSNLPILFFPVLAMFLFGLYAGKIRVFQNIALFLPQIKKIWGITLLLSIPLVIFLACLKLEIIDYEVYTQNSIQLFTSLSGLTLCFFYMSSIMLLLRKEFWQKLLRPLAFTGQMALTNYLMQTFISTFIFLGLNYFGNVSLVTGILICLGIYACQIGYSYLWLKHFRFGPFEWLWRSLTYGYVQSMKKEEKKSEVGNHVG